MQNKKIFFVFLFLLVVSAFSQTQENEEEEVVPDVNFNERKTNNIENQLVDHNSIVIKDEKLVILRKANTKNTFTGNVCAEEISRNYHFKYEFDNYGGSNARHFLPNQFKIFFLSFKNGLFWRVRYNREIKNCISRTGDYVG